MAGQGFASMSPERRKELASKGGKKAHDKGTGRRFKSGTEARTASLKGVATRKRNRALKGALVLIKAGFEPEVLNGLKLTEEEYIHYGFSTGGHEQLRERIVRGSGIQDNGDASESEG